MAKSISEYYAIWRLARTAAESYAGCIHTEYLADEQLAIQQHAVAMMARLPALTKEDVRLKICVAMSEAELSENDANEHAEDAKLLSVILSELYEALTSIPSAQYTS